MSSITAVGRARNRPASSDAVVAQLAPDIRRRIADRLAELDELARLVRERPFSGRWTA